MPVTLLRGCAGNGLFTLSEPCWTCLAPSSYCRISSQRNTLGLAPFNTTGDVVTAIGVPGGGPYRLSYQLLKSGDTPSSWKAIIQPLGGSSFPAIVLDALSNWTTFPFTARELPFRLPDGTTSVQLTFRARAVSPRKGHAISFMPFH